MRIQKKILRYQTCVYWAVSGLTEEGQRTFATPIEIPVRWEDCNEQFMDRNGNPRTSSAKVYVGVDLDLLGVLWLPPNNLHLAAGAALAQLADPSSPFSNERAYEIRKFDKIPTPKPRTEDDFLRICWL